MSVGTALNLKNAPFSRPDPLGWGVQWIFNGPFSFLSSLREALARRACALRAAGLLLADGALTVGRGKTF